ncbi:transporter substrate-binding domain-containing protein [Pseudomonas sp. CAU 1711]|uniref:substrate-binding periplasmic protein n=1 Tax=Pseudomonas sp. CAU 1711 TaxID=3140356 RepID=UPI0032618293
MPRRLYPILLALYCLTPMAAPRLATLEYPPYSTETMPGGGSIVELTERAFATQGHRPRIDFLPWARVRAELRQGTYQGALALWPQEIVEEKLIASRPLFYSQLGLFARRGDPVRFRSLDDLRGRRIGIVRGYGYPLRILKSGIVAEEAVDDISNLRKLKAGRFDLVLLERIVGEYLIAGDSRLRGRLAWQEPALERIPLVVGFVPPRPGEHDWAAVFERGLRELHARGEYMRILRRYQPR